MYRPDVKQLVNDPSFIRWVNGSADAQERDYWDSWLIKSRENRELANKAQAEITGFIIQPADAPDSSAAWSRMQQKLSDSPVRRAVLKNIFIKHVWYARIAAVLLLAVCTGLLISYTNQKWEDTSEMATVHEVVSGSGELKTVTFSDGSEVILNGNSRIQYTISHEDTYDIDVYLTGEAHFSVTDRSQTQPANPFRVQTDTGIINVLGTRFVVSARKNETQVILEEGSLSLKPPHQELETILEPGQLGKLQSPYKEVSIREVNTSLYSSWIYGRLEFNQVEVEEIAERLEDLFDVNIEIRDQTILGKKITGSIENNDLRVIISALSRMLDTPVYKDDRNGVFYFGEP